MHGDIISADELWDCTTCGACLAACPVFIDQPGAIVEMRRYLTMSMGAVSRNLNVALTNMERSGNPYGLAARPAGRLGRGDGRTDHGRDRRQKSSSLLGGLRCRL